MKVDVPFEFAPEDESVETADARFVLSTSFDFGACTFEERLLNGVG